MNALSLLKQYLITSIKKNGNQPLTLQHLVNIINLIEKRENKRDDENDLYSGYDPHWDIG